MTYLKGPPPPLVTHFAGLYLHESLHVELPCLEDDRTRGGHDTTGSLILLTVALYKDALSWTFEPGTMGLTQALLCVPLTTPTRSVPAARPPLSYLSLVNTQSADMCQAVWLALEKVLMSS